MSNTSVPIAARNKIGTTNSRHLYHTEMIDKES